MPGAPLLRRVVASACDYARLHPRLKMTRVRHSGLLTTPFARAGSRTGLVARVGSVLAPFGWTRGEPCCLASLQRRSPRWRSGPGQPAACGRRLPSRLWSFYLACGLGARHGGFRRAYCGRCMGPSSCSKDGSQRRAQSDGRVVACYRSGGSCSRPGIGRRVPGGCPSVGPRRVPPGEPL